MCDQCAAILDEDRHLELFLQGCPVAGESFPKAMYGVLLATGERLLSGYGEDVVQQMWLILVRGGTAKFDRHRSSARNYLHGILRNAARDVAACHPAPGARTRRTATDPARGRLDLLPLQEVPDPADVAVSRLNAKRILEDADAHGAPLVGQALRVIVFQGCTVTEAARKLGFHRLAVRRAIDRWGRTFQEAEVSAMKHADGPDEVIPRHGHAA